MYVMTISHVYVCMTVEMQPSLKREITEALFFIFRGGNKNIVEKDF